MRRGQIIPIRSWSEDVPDPDVPPPAPEVDALLCALTDLAGGGGLLPADPTMLGFLLGDDWSPAELEEHTQRLHTEGRLRWVVLGREAHWLVAPPGDCARDALTPPVPGDTSPPRRDPPPSRDGQGADDLARFQRALAIDAARETLLLYRVVLCVLGVLGLVLVREWIRWLIV